ncbi:MAG: aminoacyl-tRNA hydrolase [Candidatus Woesebacteria bacterium]|jgi:PTH1 family peptidyl-tRNA hydrolase
MSENKTKLIIGLGNLDAKYNDTRHNTGFKILDDLADHHKASWQTKTKFKSVVAEISSFGQKAILAKPTTYYNLSGEAARAICDFYKIESDNVLAIHDELALPFGTIRTRVGGSSAGNNGIKSLIAHIGQDFLRIRVGIANDHSDQKPADQFVLNHFTEDEQKRFRALELAAFKFVDDFINDSKNFAHDSVKV